jgi:hypothetical protein
VTARVAGGHRRPEVEEMLGVVLVEVEIVHRGQ